MPDMQQPLPAHINALLERAVPEWVRQWGWFLILAQTSITMLVAGVVGTRYGQAAGWAMLLIPAAGLAVLWGTGYTRRRDAARIHAARNLHGQLEASKLDDLTPDEFQAVYCPALLRGLGYTDVEFVGNAHGRKDVDIIATGPDGTTMVAVECKHKSRSIGPDVPRHLAGTLLSGPYKKRSGIVMSSGPATPGAHRAAKERGVTLADRPVLLDWAAQARARLEPPASPPSSARLRLTSRALITASWAAVTIPALLIVLRPWGTAPASPATPPPPAPLARTASPAVAVRAFYAAISEHNWQKVWQLGGKNLARRPWATYPEMITGYQATRRDVLQILTVNGDTVTGSFLAYQTRGTQPYTFRWTVQGGVIVSGHQAPAQTAPP